MTRFLHAVGRRGPLLLAASIVVGLALPPLAELLRPALTPAVFGLLALSMTRVDLAELRRHLAVPVRLAAAVGWAVVLLPAVLGLVMLYAWAPPPGIALGLILITSAPSIISSPALSYLLGLDGALSLAFLLLATAVTPLVAPAMVYLFVGGGIALPPLALAVRLAILVGGAFLVAVVVRRLLGRPRIAASQPLFDGVNVLLMMLFAIALMDGIGARFLADPLHFLLLTALVFAAAVAMFALTTAVFWRQGARVATTIGYSSGFRNMALAVGAMGTAVPDDTWTMFAVIQFPIYFSPMLLAPVCRRLLAAG